MPPPKLALRFPRLLPILYKLYQHSISGCSKDPVNLYYNLVLEFGAFRPGSVGDLEALAAAGVESTLRYHP